ncbi:DUF3048 domain-containing protein [Anaerocolumna aminovalerica]|uniref:DUF3048 domain-containing protein n=1 Tax=Anaerocolumna aminovalerica TaxID=1527 RepID=UPI000BE27F78|nr:DUF3048 domain-containing protein [Anaerocolumna aminovalerica]
MKKRILLLLLTITACFLIACKKKGTEDNNQITPTPTATLTPAPTEEPENHDNEVKSKLTGLWIPKEYGDKRPYAIMFNNLKLASPQSGISEASVLYEAIVEGGITRLMGIFEEQNLNEERIGSIRSARHYYVNFADAFDAIYLHFGETTYAKKKMKKLGINDLDGLTGIGDTVYYRDKSIKAPHNAFTSKDKILKGVEIKGYERNYQDGYEGNFQFFEKDTDLSGGMNAEKVTIPFSNDYSPYFTYDSKDKVYKRFQFDKEHTDYNTGKQLTFKNILVQFVKEWDIDKNDYQTMDIEDSSGKGFYITNGKAVEISWTMKEANRSLEYFDASGKKLTINPGKTYIAVFPNDRTSKTGEVVME